MTVSKYIIIFLLKQNYCHVILISLKKLLSISYIRFILQLKILIIIGMYELYSTNVWNLYDSHTVEGLWTVIF